MPLPRAAIGASGELEAQGDSVASASAWKRRTRVPLARAPSRRSPVCLQLRGVAPRLRTHMLLKTKQPRLERFETNRTPGDLARLIEQPVSAFEGGGRFYPIRSWRGRN
jgi:hypothetical protein